ncbi:hypothetical protein P3X46_029039 [Hevea brasiliensis]|uniref:SMP-LTD domain-containing protein n=1 Tax=Hevea brasiliensis TaxID=3981 RepID=A0ABQ9KQZ7_HEVBR|nr:uncharacterized protein LOC110666389 isoform X1 [Hevea brasiliensis]KAJ9146815.1 hypothetical protein P3X46_029039 [Hevea brasiliensis]
MMLTRWLLVFVAGFSVGALAVVAFEVLGVYVFFKRFNRKIRQEELKSSSPSSHKDLDPKQSLDYFYNKKGVVWVLEPDKVPRNWVVDKVPKEQKKKKDLFEVNPVKKYAKIMNRFLVLTDSDGSHAAFPLKGCIVEAVSATDLSTRKWAKRFPIKVESKTSVIYNASKVVYIYLETSWEKESWCKALRLASCDDKEKLNWFTKLNEEFHCYLASLNTGYPSFMKPSAGFIAEPIDRVTKFDGSASKVCLFLKKLARKASKTSVENRGTFSLGHEEKKINDKSHSFQDPILSSSLIKTTPITKALVSSEENKGVLSSSTFSCSMTQTPISVSDVGSDENLNTDEGTLCWNLLFSRIFFDARSNPQIKSSFQARIQRTLSNMRTPSYIGEVVCTDLGLGSLPPYIHGIRVLPTDMNEIWAWEVDVEYCGGLVLDIETRLEVQKLQKDMVDTNSESSSVGDVSSDLLEGFEYFGKQLNISGGTADEQEQENEGNNKLDGLKNSTSYSSTSTNVSRWKSILNSIAQQVSQVPLSLSIRVASLRGTLRLHMKPPPSDQLWCGFTSMPDIEFDSESSVGEHKINSIALFLISRFKASIRETMVLPNCESLCIPWMLAEKNDWVPRTVAPFMWLNREAASDHATACEAHGSEPDEAKPKEEAHRRASNNDPESKHLKTKNPECSQQSISDSSDAVESALSCTKPSMQSSKFSQELTSPLLASYEPQEISQQSRGCISERQSLSRSLAQVEKQNQTVEENDSRPKRMGRRARMLDLGKKMGDKLEEKRRHIEEKGRSIVEKMRGP